MSILSRLFRAKPETRSLATYSDGWQVAGMAGGYGPRVDANAAQSLAAVTACVSLISGALASLPASLTMDTPDGLQPAPPTATGWALLRRPCDHMSWPAWIRFMVTQYLIHGNAVAWIQTDGRGAVTSATPVAWPWLNPMVLAGQRPQLVFDVQAAATPDATLLGLPPRLLASDTIHIRNESDTGVLGRGVLSRAAPALANALALQAAAAGFWSNSFMPSGIITVGQQISPEGMRRLETFITSRQAGAGNAGRPFIADKDTTWTPIQATPAEAELLGSRAYSTAETCRLFSVPEILIQQGNTPPADYSSAIAALAQLCLAPIVSAITAEVDSAILPAGMHLRLDLGALERGSFAAAIGAMAVGKNAGFLAANDCRAMLGLPACDGGDKLTPGKPLNYPADQSGVPSLAPKPGPGATAMETVGTHNNEGAG